MPTDGLVTPTFDLDFAISMAIALGIGALIGLERERHREARTVLAGVRTYPLVALAGALFAHLGDTLDSGFYIAVGAVVFGGFALVLYWVRHTLGLHGLTSPIALFVTYIAGALIGLGFQLEGIIAGVATAVLLFTKTRLHRIAEVMTEEEMSGALQFIIVAFILFPLITDQPLDPWGILNLRRLLLIVIFVSGISFISFLTLRVIGPDRGLSVSGLLGGLINSEATTGGLAHVARQRPNLQSNAIEGILFTNGTMLLRNLLIAAFVDPSLRFARIIAPALVGMLIVQIAVALYKRPPLRGEGEDIRLGNPFAIMPALKFALVFLLLQAVSIGLRHIPGAGEAGVMLTAVGGLVSSAAVVASVGTLVADGQVSLSLAGMTAILAIIVSTLNKLLLTRSIHPELEPLLRYRILAVAGTGLLLLATVFWFK